MCLSGLCTWSPGVRAQVTGTLPAWSNSEASLQILDLQGNALSGTVPEQWTDFVSMVEVDLSYNFLSVSSCLHLACSGPFRSFSRLASFSRLTVVKGHMPAWEAGLENLTYLSLANNSLSGDHSRHSVSLMHRACMLSKKIMDREYSGGMEHYNACSDRAGTVQQLSPRTTT